MKVNAKISAKSFCASVSERYLFIKRTFLRRKLCISEKVNISILFRALNEQFLAVCPNCSGSVVKTAFSVARRTFWRQSWKKIDLCVSFLDNSQKSSKILPTFPRQVCQNCIPSVLRIILSKKVCLLKQHKSFMFFGRYAEQFGSFGDSCPTGKQNNIPLHQKNISMKKISERKNNFPIIFGHRAEMLQPFADPFPARFWKMASMCSGDHFDEKRFLSNKPFFFIISRHWGNFFDRLAKSLRQSCQHCSPLSRRCVW